jgi:cbb3-type cytochrome oxidase maturation protein
VPFIVYLIIGLIIGGLFFGLAIMGLNWAVKNGQFRDLDKGSRVVFDDEEPEGQQTDFFPGRGRGNGREG